MCFCYIHIPVWTKCKTTSSAIPKSRSRTRAVNGRAGSGKRTGKRRHHTSRADLTDAVEIRHIHSPCGIYSHRHWITKFCSRTRAVCLTRLTAAGKLRHRTSRTDLTDEMIVSIRYIYVPIDIYGYPRQTIEARSRTVAVCRPFIPTAGKRRQYKVRSTELVNLAAFVFDKINIPLAIPRQTMRNKAVLDTRQSANEKVALPRQCQPVRQRPPCYHHRVTVTIRCGHIVFVERTRFRFRHRHGIERRWDIYRHGKALFGHAAVAVVRPQHHRVITHILVRRRTG